MSSAFGPFSLGSCPASKDFTERDPAAPKDIDAKRFNRRRGLLSAVDEHFRSTEKSDRLSAMDRFYSAAHDLISSKQARGTFELNAEPSKLSDEYVRPVDIVNGGKLLTDLIA
jgi:hypothetical protein